MNNNNNKSLAGSDSTFLESMLCLFRFWFLSLCIEKGISLGTLKDVLCSHKVFLKSTALLKLCAIKVNAAKLLVV